MQAFDSTALVKLSVNVSLEHYLRMFEDTYVATYISAGGSSVKALLATSSTRNAIRNGIQRAAETNNFTYVHVDSASTKIQNLHDVFFAISSALNWLGLSRRWIRRVVGQAVKLDDSDLTLSGIYRANDGEAFIVRQRVDEVIQTQLFARLGLSGEFRRAVYQVIWSILVPAWGRAHVTAAVLEWLSGSLARLVVVKPAKLHRRIGKTNARQMLTSLPRWLRDCGSAGLIVTMDMTSVVGKETSTLFRGRKYTRASVIDAYEVLRQFIDSIDEIEGFALLVLADDGFADDPKRGIDIYPALRMRLSEDVWDHQRANPLAPMVRIAS